MNLTVADMLSLQKRLQDAHPEWGGVKPERGVNILLWLVGELGEVIDIVKKSPPEAYITTDGAERAHFVEELSDAAMYFCDLLLCYGVTAEEFSEAFAKKNAYNMVRDWNDGADITVD